MGVSLLASFVYLEEFRAVMDNVCPAIDEWVLDSGAFSAWNSGHEINLDDYISVCKELMSGEYPPAEIFGLDVIGDWEKSLKNVEKMWKEGIEAIPTFHPNEPEEYLEHIAREYDKIALGGAAGKGMTKFRVGWIEQCFARVWPCKIHGFGMGSVDTIIKFPFHSVDTSSWTAFLQFNRFAKDGGGVKLRRVPEEIKWKVFRSQIDAYMALEEKARIKWINVWSKKAPKLRLAYVGIASPPRRRAFLEALGGTDIKEVHQKTPVLPSKVSRVKRKSPRFGKCLDIRFGKGEKK